MIEFTEGDSVVLNLTALDGSGNPINITGATFTTQIMGPANTPVSFDNSHHAVVGGPLGTFTLTLSTTETASIATGEQKEILTKIVVGGATSYVHGYKLLRVNPAVPIR